MHLSISEPLETIPQGNPIADAFAITSNKSFLKIGSPPVTLIIMLPGLYASAISSNTFSIFSPEISLQLISPQRLPQNSQKALHRNVASQNSVFKRYSFSFIYLSFLVKILICEARETPTGNTIFYVSCLLPQIPPTDFMNCQQTELPKVNKAYLWPRSKVWMRALKASIQTAATKVTNMLYLPSGVRLLRSPTNQNS